MRMSRLAHGAAITVLVLASANARPDPLEIIPLKHRTVEQVLPVLQPLLEPGGTLSGTQNQLFVRTSPRNLAELKQALASIDTIPRRLVITVRQDAGSRFERREGEIAGTVTAGRVVIGAGRPATERGVTARVEDARSSSNEGLVQQIQVLEGSPALIQTGQSVPVVTRTVTARPGGGVIIDTATYRDATSGFEVVPRVVGDRVMLDISPQHGTLEPGGGVNIQNRVSTVNGRLGEWFELGGSAQDEARERSGLLSGSSATRQDSHRVWVK